MKIAPWISTLFVGFSLLPHGVESFKVVENFLGKSKIAEVQNAVHCKDKNDYGSDSSDGGFTFLKQDILSRIHKTALLLHNQGLFFKPSTDTQQQLVPTRVIRETTRSHQDRFCDDANRLVEDDVVFLFLNTNTDATFVHGNDSTAVEAGSMVRFRGDVPHHTVVNKGFVQLVGPFHATSLKPVGSCRSFEGDCGACDLPSCCNAALNCFYDPVESRCRRSTSCSSTDCGRCDPATTCTTTEGCEVITIDEGLDAGLMICREVCGNGLDSCRSCDETQCAEQMPMCFQGRFTCLPACFADVTPEEFIADCSDIPCTPPTESPSGAPSEAPSEAPPTPTTPCPFSFNIFAWIFCLVGRFLNAVF